MLTLPVIKPRTYLSPSALKIWRNCQQQFYLYYLAGFIYVHAPQSLAAAIGTVFDAFIKDYIAKERKMHRPDLDINRLLEGLEVEKSVNKNEAIKLGKRIAIWYKEVGLAKIFLKADQVDLDREMYINFGGIPILGILDAVVDGTPLDFKLRGFGSKYTASLTPGYSQSYSYTGHRLGSYVGKAENPNIEHKQESWALQLLWYNWLLGNSTRHYIIHEICCNKTNEWKYAEHQGEFSYAFDRSIRTELEQLWSNINDLNVEIEEPTPCLNTCERFKQVCIVADKCEAYQRTLGSEHMRERL